jgi:hypothetical protein
MPPESLMSMFPEGAHPVWFLVLGSLSAMLLGATKAGFAGGIGLLSTPLMVYACGGRARLALAVMLPLLIAGDYASMTRWWGKWEFRRVWPMILAAVGGVALGWLAMRAIGAAGPSDGGPAEPALTGLVLKLLIGGIALGFVGLQVARWIRGDRLRLRPRLSTGLAVGGVAGFTSTLSHAAGPIVTMYLLPQGMAKGTYVATTLLFYWVGNQIKLIPYGFEGWLTAESLWADLLLLPAVVVGAVIGFFLHSRVNEKVFRAVVYSLLALAGAHLTYNAVRGLIG